MADADVDEGMPMAEIEARLTLVGLDGFRRQLVTIKSRTGGDWLVSVPAFDGPGLASFYVHDSSKGLVRGGVLNVADLDERKRVEESSGLKLMLHPDLWQFSGPKILSGKGKGGAGMEVDPAARVPGAPLFSVQTYRTHAFPPPKKPKGIIEFYEQDVIALTPGSSIDSLVIMGYWVHAKPGTQLGAPRYCRELVTGNVPTRILAIIPSPDPAATVAMGVAVFGADRLHPRFSSADPLGRGVLVRAIAPDGRSLEATAPTDMGGKLIQHRPTS